MTADVTLHQIGLPHALLQPEFSHDPFAGKCLRFPKMVQMQGFTLIEYAHADSHSDAQTKVPLMPRSEFERLKQLYDEELARGVPHAKTTLHRVFDARLAAAMVRRAKPGDIVCHPYGHTHYLLGEILPDCYHVETGIGYDGTFFPLKVFESYAWWHYHQGKRNSPGKIHEWVIPNYYDLDEWEPCYDTGQYILYFGRVIEPKGLNMVKEIARHVQMPVIMCGKGDPEPFLDERIPNLSYKPPITGRARSDLLRHAYCMLMPTEYTEPFGGAGVEGLLCGTPLLASDHGAFSETVMDGFTGFRCKTLGDWLDAIEKVPRLCRRSIAEFSRSKYSLETCGQQFARVFEQIIHNQGFNTTSLVASRAIPPADYRFVPPGARLVP